VTSGKCFKSFGPLFLHEKKEIKNICPVRLLVLMGKAGSTAESRIGQNGSFTNTASED
jgi:hypothetical protein